jgi:putative transposase
MRELDELYLKEPTWGARKLSHYFALLGRPECRKRLTRLRRRMGLETIYQKPRTSLPGGPRAQRFPYLLRGVPITQPDHVWCADITYVPMAHGSFYLVVVMDWATRMVLAWELSNTLESDFCLLCLRRALELNPERKPLIFNTDQGCQFTSIEWVNALTDCGIKVSHDGKGRWMDNVFIERLWRSYKYDDIYLKSYQDGRELERGTADYLHRYSHVRPHASLGGRTPAMAYATAS